MGMKRRIRCLWGLLHLHRSPSLSSVYDVAVAKCRLNDSLDINMING